jgi:hypothetical protein
MASHRDGLGSSPGQVIFLRLRSVRRLLVTANVVLSSPILVARMKEVPSYSETSDLTRATRRNIPEDANLQTVYALLICPMRATFLTLSRI